MHCPIIFFQLFFLHMHKGVNTAGSVSMSIYLTSGTSASLFLGVDMLPSFHVR